ncbi:hypothetical protein [Epilithonimonas sp. UC225_85]|uniref:hypothetical protein n=1 Tax=Epilithonimonas sp. UC225_85 TaxID=3350167 RepID=UPI0036D3050F
MSKKFILSLTIVASLVSCREAGEIVDNDKVNTNDFVVLRNKPEDKGTISRDSSDAKDSIRSSFEGEEKPPIKNGEHWKH